MYAFTERQQKLCLQIGGTEPTHALLFMHKYMACKVFAMQTFYLYSSFLFISPRNPSLPATAVPRWHLKNYFNPFLLFKELLTFQNTEAKLSLSTVLVSSTVRALRLPWMTPSAGKYCCLTIPLIVYSYHLLVALWPMSWNLWSSCTITVSPLSLYLMASLCLSSKSRMMNVAGKC